jgi:hypothetical protein
MSDVAGANTSAPSEEAVKYESDTVKVIRGMESKTIAKRESEGWELVSQVPGTLRSELSFRRPKPKTPWRMYAIIGGVMVVLFAFIGIMAAISGGDGDAAPTPSETSTAEAAVPSADPSAEPAETAPIEDEASAAVPTTVDELLDRLNSADMGGIKTGDRFQLSGELFMSDLWMTGATGDYFVMLKAQNGAQDLTVFVDEAEAANWTDGTKVDMVLEAVDATIDGETSGGWLRAISTTVVS